MIRLVLIALAAIYGVLHIFGDESRRVADTVRPEPFTVGLTKATYSLEIDQTETSFLATSSISEAEAVQIALKAGAAARHDRESNALQGDVAQVAFSAENAATAPETVSAIWTVTGSRVNLRSGPGRSNGVVGQLTRGAAAEVLANIDGWYQIRALEGDAAGWIFGDFLQPG